MLFQSPGVSTGRVDSIVSTPSLSAEARTVLSVRPLYSRECASPLIRVLANLTQVPTLLRSGCCTRMVSSGVLGEKGRSGQGGVVGVVRVGGVDQAVGVASGEEGARGPGAVQQGGGGRRDGYPGREDQRRSQGRAGRPHRGGEARKEALGLGSCRGYAPPLLVAGCNVERCTDS